MSNFDEAISNINELVPVSSFSEGDEVEKAELKLLLNKARIDRLFFTKKIASGNIFYVYKENGSVEKHREFK